jgi:predicted ATP-grasp superfamily ATP-dependent carboligase
MKSGSLNNSARVAPVIIYGNGGLNLLRCFSDSRLPVFVISPNASDCTFYSRYNQNSKVIAEARTSPEKALKQLLESGPTFPAKPVIIYGDDAKLLLLSRYREQLTRYYRFLMPSASLVENLVGKAGFAELAERHQLPVPRTVLSGQLSDRREITRHLSFPCVLKPANHVGWLQSAAIMQAGGLPQKMLRADNAAEFARMYQLIRQFTDDFVIQEYIAGGDDCIYSFHAYYNQQAQPLACFVGRKIRTYPKDSGVSTYLELVKEPQVIALGKEILRKLNFVGPVKIDFKRDRERQKFFMLEINARFNLWHYLGAACGVNLPQLAYCDLTGAPIALPADYRTDVRWLSFGDDLRGFLRSYHRDGDLSWREWLSSFRGKKVYDIFSWRDPYPFLRYAAAYTRRGIENRLVKLR